MSRKTLIFIGAIIVFAIVAFVAIEITSQPEFCARCHEIAPAVESWRQFSHNEVSCMECHADPGAIGVIKRKAGAYKEVYIHFFGEVPKEMEANVKYDNCLLCHSGKRSSKYPQAKNIVEEDNDLVTLHKDIIAEKTSCLNCHKEVAHGNLD